MEQVLPVGWCQWEGVESGKGHGRINIVQIVCTHACKCVNGIGVVCDQKTSNSLSHVEESIAGHVGVNGVY
jgi:hypothetical protein